MKLLDLTSTNTSAMSRMLRASAIHRIFQGLGSLALIALLSACATRVPLTDWSSPPPVPEPVYSNVVSTGDVLEIHYYLESKVQSAPYKLEVGDVVRIDIDGYPDLTREKITVLPDGTISLPLLGTFPIAGKSSDEAAAQITQLYVQRKLKNPLVVISVEEAQLKLKRLLESRHLGLDAGSLVVPIYQGMPISLPFIAPIQVDRPLDDIRKQITDSYNTEFGAQVSVVVNLRQREEPSILVMGEVKAPGKVAVTRALTPLSAVAFAGGYTDQADPSKVVVLRFSPEAGYQRWLFDLKNDINEPNAPQHNFKLAKNDIVLVVKSDIADVNLWITQYIRNNIPVSIDFTRAIGH